MILFMYWVYILYSDNFKRFYIGQTNDLSKRLRRHNDGYEKSTSPFIPWRLVCKIQKDSRSEAVILERKLKNLNTEDLNKFINKYSADLRVG
jgi:putative endonuclease